MRGRNNNNRKGPNPLSRSYESNGPDVKIRGTAAHIADKYVQLARDATSSGDPISAENYLQHAEHYYRILAAAQPQYPQGQTGFVRADDESRDEEGDEDGNEGQSNGFDGQQPNGGGYPQQQAPQSYGQGGDGQQRRDYQPREHRDHQPREQRDHQPREQREPREQRDHQPREQREPREQRDHQPREQRDHQPREQRDYQAREQRESRPQNNQNAPNTNEQAPGGLPAFITGGGSTQEPQGGQSEGEGGFGRNRNRRRFGRYGRNGAPGEQGSPEGGPAPSSEPEIAPGE